MEASPKCSGCDQPASSLRCPTCLKQGLPDSLWCGQACFKSNWATHKAVHAATTGGPFVDPRFVGFRYSGPLRKCQETPRRQVPASIPPPVYVNNSLGRDPRETDAKRGNQVAALTAAGVAKMREVCRLGREVLDEAHKTVRVGVTTDEIDRVVHEACMERQVYPSPLGYSFFPKSCCTSVNEVICHGIPDKYELRDGDIVNVDVSCFFKGHHADLNETYLVGNVDDVGKKLVRVTYECLWKAIAECKPGVYYRDMGNVISKHAKANGFDVVRTYCGHGVGELFHCNPTVPHYAKNKAVGVMKPGHCFTIEPMINEGSYHDYMWPDQWTCTTEDGKRSAQFEETILITDTGCEVLTKGTYVPDGAQV